jgi:hypothetical protein
VKYTWKLSDTMSELAVYPGSINSPAQPVTDGCLYQYKTPVVATRQVFSGGSAILTQTFTYSTAWASAGTTWTQKTTSVSSKDNVVNETALTAYTYQPTDAPHVPYSDTNYSGQIAVESTAQSYDWGNTSSPLRTINKGWINRYLLGCETVALENGLASATWYVYDAIFSSRTRKSMNTAL